MDLIRVLALHVYAAHPVAHMPSLNVLSLSVSWLFHGLFHECFIRLPDTTETHIETGTRLLQLHARVPCTGLLKPYGTMLDVHSVVGSSTDDHPVNACKIDLSDSVALEEIQHEGLEERKLRLHFEVITKEQKQGFAFSAGHGCACPRALLYAFERIRVHIALDHVQQLVVEQSPEDQIVRALFGVRSIHEQTGVILLREEFHGGCVLERPGHVTS